MALYITIIDENDNFHEFFVSTDNDTAARHNITEAIDRVNFG